MLCQQLLAEAVVRSKGYSLARRHRHTQISLWPHRSQISLWSHKACAAPRRLSHFRIPCHTRAPQQMSGEEYLGSKPDPVAKFAAPVCGHMNDDHQVSPGVPGLPLLGFGGLRLRV